MSWLVICFAFTALMVGWEFWRLTRAFGQKAVGRNIRYVLLGLLAVLLTAIALPPIASLMSERNLSSLSILYLLPTIGFGLWGLSWPYRKRASGGLLLDVGRTWQNNILFWIGIMEGGVATFVTWLSFSSLLGSPDTVEGLLRMPRVAFWWMLCALLISIGLSKLELREKGLCFLYTVIPWQRVSAYRWEGSRRNTFTIEVRRRLLLSSGFISIKVLERQRNEIERIVTAHIHRS